MSLEPARAGAQEWECRASVECQRVKEEWEEETDGQQEETDGVHIKEEPEWTDLNSSLKSGLLELYAGHKVEGDLVLGPEGLQLPDSAFAQPTCGRSPLPGPDGSVSAGQAAARAGRGSGEPRPLQRQLHAEQVTASSRFVEQLKVYSGDRPPANHQLSPDGSSTLFKPACTGAKPYSCDVCMKQFISKKSLAVHKRTHTGVKTYICGVCMRQYKCIKYLVDHIRTHSKGNPYSCDMCVKQLTTEHGLAIHRRTHSKEKLYQ